jgi:hypothetical protein
MAPGGVKGSHHLRWRRRESLPSQEHLRHRTSLRNRPPRVSTEEKRRRKKNLVHVQQGIDAIFFSLANDLVEFLHIVRLVDTSSRFEPFPHGAEAIDIHSEIRQCSVVVFVERDVNIKIFCLRNVWRAFHNGIHTMEKDFTTGGCFNKHSFPCALLLELDWFETKGRVGRKESQSGGGFAQHFCPKKYDS